MKSTKSTILKLKTKTLMTFEQKSAAKSADTLGTVFDTTVTTFPTTGIMINPRHSQRQG